MGHAGNFPKHELIVVQVLEDHDDDRHVHRIRPERKPVSIGPHTRERCLCVRDREHLPRGVEGHHGTRGKEKRRETARARTQVEDALSRLDSPHLDESAQPEPAIGRVVRADGIVVQRPPRIVDRHASCKCPTAYEPSGNRDDDRGIQYHADREGF